MKETKLNILKKKVKDMPKGALKEHLENDLKKFDKKDVIK